MFIPLSRLIAIAVAIATPALVVGQTVIPSTLSLSSPSAVSGQTVALNLALNSASTTAPAALQWTIAYPSGSVDAVSLGNTLPVAGKSLTCVGGVGTFSCVLNGPNQDAIPSGAVATILVTISRTVASSINIGLTNAVGASANADPLPIATVGGVV